MKTVLFFSLTLTIAVLLGTRCSGEPQIFADRSYQKTINGVSHNIHTASIRFTQDDVANPFEFEIVNPSTGEFVRNVSITVGQPSFVYAYNHVGYIPKAVFPVIHILDLVPIGGINTSTIDNYQNITSLVPISDDPGTGLQLQSLSPTQRSFLLQRYKQKNNLQRRPPKGHHSNHYQPVSLQSNELSHSPGQRFRKKNAMKRHFEIQSAGSSFESLGDNAEGRAAFGSIGGAIGFAAGGPVGLVAGFAVGWILGGDGGSNDATKWKALEKELGDVNKTAFDAYAWASQAQTQLKDVAVFENETLISEITTKEQIGDLSDKLAKEVNRTDTLARMVDAMRANFTQDFATLYQDINQTSQSVEGLYNITKSIWNTTQRQVGQIFNSLLTVERGAEDLSLTVFNMYRDINMRRAMTQLVFQNIDNPTPLAAYPFVRSVGLPPMSVDERAAYRTLENALVISAVHMQYTALDPLNSNQYTAYDYRVTFRCDAEFLLNNTVPGISFKTLFSFIGPADTAAGTRCFPYNTTNTSTVWQCDCVVAVEKSHCQMNDQTGTNLFPTSWIPTVSLSSSRNLTDICATAVLTDEIDPSSTSISTISFVTDLASWNSWLETQCLGSTDYFGGVNGTKLRLTSESLGIYKDLQLNLTDESVPTPCEPSFALLFNTQNNLKRLSYNMYQMWMHAYTASMHNTLAAAEVKLFGLLMTDVVPASNVADRRPDSSQTFRSVELAYVRISEEKLPVYALAPIALDHEVFISLTDASGSTQQMSTVGDQFNFSVGVDNFVGNFTWTSNVDLVATFDQLFPPARTMIVGDLFEVDGVTKTDVIYDVPWSRMCDGITASSRKGCINYIFQNTTEGPTAPIELIDWLARNKEPFDHYSAFESAMYYAREHTIIPGYGSVCGLQVPTDGNLSQVTNASLTDYNLCTLLQFADIEPEPANPRILYFNPRQFSLTGTFEIPAGQIVEQVLSECPTSYNITRAPGSQNALLCLSGLQPNPVTATVVTSGTITRCRTSRSVTYYAHRSTCVVISACGTQYINVFTEGSSTPCWVSPGVRADIDQLSPATSSVSPQIGIYVGQTADVISDSLSTIFSLYANLRASTANLPWQSPTTQDLIDKFQDQLSNYTETLRNQSQQFNFTDSNDIWEKAIAQIEASAEADLAALIEAQKKFNETMSAIIAAQTASLMAQMLGLANLTDLQKQWLADLIQQSADLTKLNDAIENSHCDDSIPLLGPIVCALASVFGSFGGGIFSMLMHLLLYIVIFGVIICFCVQCGPMIFEKCCSGGNNVFKKLANSVNKKPKAEDEEELVRPKDSLSRATKSGTKFEAEE